MGSKARSEERRKKQKKKKKKKKSKRHHYSSSSPSSSFYSTEISTSSDETRQLKKKRHRQDSDSESSGRKHRKRRHSTQTRKGEKHAQKEDLPKQACHSSATDGNRGLPSPQEVASAMLCKFPELANDLEQLLKMLDDGQAVDLTGLTNEHVAAYLKQLFQSLLLQKTVQGLYFLPDGASRKTLDVLSSVLSSPERIKDSGQQGIDKEEKDSPQVAYEDGLADHYGPVEQKRRVLGPAMPSTDMLEAAARLTAAGPSPREVDEDISMEPFVGPPPPAAVKDAESANEAERFEEVERILAPDVGNAYELMGLRVGALADAMKKRYWKLSLLVHPDKCTHPQAHAAFTALNQAFKDLQDPIKRTKIDEQIQEKETREEFEGELKAKREAAEWRKIRGESLPGDDALLDTPKVMVRDEWMTQLPPERKAGAPTQQSTFFSRNAKSGRGDTSVWTDTPMDKVRKAKMGFLEGERQSMLSNESEFFYKEDRGPASAGIMDQFNSVKRGTSLVEKHQRERTKVKKAPNKKEALQPAEWAASHPWKPWDRDKDLTAGRQKVDLDKSNMAEGLTSRFSSAHKERNFL